MGLISLTSIAIPPDGLPVMAYADASGGAQTLAVRKCSDVACTSSVESIADPTPGRGLHASLTIGADGYPVVAYYDSTAADLMVLKCGNPFCRPNWTRR